MTEIEIGEYIRTKKGMIAKVCSYQDLTTYDDKGISVTFHSFDTDKGTIADIEIAKHSKNIIDLIEVGDFVNGYKVQSVEENLLHTKMIYFCAGYVRSIENKEIRTILTKEQYENDCYKVGE